MNLKVIWITLSLLAGFCSMQPSLAKSVIAAENIHQSVVLDMQNMSCAMCQITIKKALQNVDGVQQVKVDFDSKTANVTFNPKKTNIEALIESTTNVGYPATLQPRKQVK